MNQVTKFRQVPAKIWMEVSSRFSTRPDSAKAIDTKLPLKRSILDIFEILWYDLLRESFGIMDLERRPIIMPRNDIFKTQSVSVPE